jgi:hypothetical protein
MSYYQLASDLLLGSVKVPAIEREYGLVFRQGKDVEDILHAIKKAKAPKNGMLKIEYEIGALELYLKSILKRSKKKESKQ